MDLALYDHDSGYYARVGQRSGRAGDFFTSVDVGSLFGELLAVQLREMAQVLEREDGHAGAGESALRDPEPGCAFDLVEAGAGSGRLSADILRAVRQRDPAFYETIRLHLVEASEAARTLQIEVLGAQATADSGKSPQLTSVADRLRSSTAVLPETFEGALIANELLDAMPVHQVVMREQGLREVFVAVHHDAGEPTTLYTIEGPPSTPALQQYLDRAGAHLEPGWRAEINLRAIDWIRDAARRLSRGFIVLIDYGHEAHELYSVTHSAGTLTTFTGHRSRGPEHRGAPAWLSNAGEQDITAHVDFTSVRKAAEAEGMTTIALLDQTYFLLGLVSDSWSVNASAGQPRGADAAARAAALKTLIMPGGLGSTQKVLVLGKGVGVPALKGCSFKVRLT